jgi:baseplate J-like protein
MTERGSYLWPNLTGGPVTTGKQGIDYLIVAPDQLSLRVYFLQPVTSGLEKRSIFRIEGGDRIKTIPITSVKYVLDPLVKDYLRIDLERFGDFAPYRLILVEEVWEKLDIDPVFASIRFSFKINCPSDIDCKAHLPGFDRFPALRNFDYQAKDYESFKQAMFDRLTLTLPDWWDRAEADFGVALVDLLAFAGDRLSYYQDRVAAESVLKTARSRQSVSGHLKLIDYTLDPGETSTAYVYFDVDRDMTIPDGAKVETRTLSDEEPLIFTLKTPFAAYEGLNRQRLRLYDFSHPSLMIPKGAVQVAVSGTPKGLESGSHIVFENGEEGKQLIRLSGKPVYKTATDGTEITVLTWDVRDSLAWDLPISSGLLYGNIAECVHGTAEKETFTVEDRSGLDDDPPGYEKGALIYRDLLKGPLAYRTGAPMISVTVDGEAWELTASLKESAPYQRHYQVIDLDEGRNRILFGDGRHGLRPVTYSFIEITYHVAPSGSRGNVAPDTLIRLSEDITGVRSVANPFPGADGKAPETEDHARLWGPKRIREQKRAVTGEDYAREAMSVSGVSRAIARFVWTGSWFTVRVTLDPEDTEEVSDDLKARVYSHLRSRKMAGYDLSIMPARYVPLEVQISFCLKALAFRDQVLRDLLSALGNRQGADGVEGFFHADRWTFGKGVTLSSLYAAIGRVQGIECAEVTKFKRLRKTQGDELINGEIPMQWDEIAQLYNDRNFPERGRLDLELVGGR